MSDFFMPTQNNQEIKDQEAENYRNAAKNVQNQEIETYKQKKQQHLENWDRYGVNVPDEYYDAFNKIIAQAPTPEEAQEEAYKIGSAVKYSEAMGIPLLEAYQNVDAFNEAQFTDLQGQKGRFEALSDMLNLGRNNVKLGRLGQELMQAHSNNDTELANALMTEIDAINQQNQLMQDNAPRSWVMQALEAGAQSLPFTGVVAGAGIVGNFIAPAVGTGASFAASSYLSAGTEYIDMIANGASPETARLVASVSGGIQGLIEADLGISKSIVKSTARVIGKEAAENAAKKSVEEIGRKVFKRFHFGAGKKVLINYLENRGKDILGEGTEEFLQEITSIVGQEVAASLDGYDIPDDDFKSIVKQTTEAFRGGVLGALSMGFIPAGINAAADVKEYKLIKDTAEVFESEEMFKEAAKDSPVFEGMSDEAKADTIHEVWQRAQNRKEIEAQQIAEGRDAGEGAEEAAAENEDGTTEAQAVARNDAGRLYTSNDVSTDDAGNVTGGTFVIGDKTKSENNRYGYIKYSQDAEGNITIDTFKMTEGREGLRAEAFDDFAREHPDVKIEWNAVGSEMQDAKQALIDANPSGAKNGLNYYSTNELDNVAARKMVAEEVRKNIHNVKRNADGSYTRTELSNKQVAAAVTLIESAARRMGMGLNEYVNKTFGNQIFGTSEEFAQASLAQGEDVTKKAGGMYQGVAQSNWREVGQQIKAVIYAGENADFSTWAHEMAHVFQNQLEGDLKTEAEAAFNVQDGDWIHSTYTFKGGRTMSSAEAFAYGFQDWLETGKAENEQMRNIFQKFAEFIADCYNRLKSHLDFSPEIVDVFNKLLDGDDTIMSKALKAAQEQDNEYRAILKRQAEEKQAQQEAEKEEAKKQAQAEREEAEEGTDFAENAPTAEDLLNGIEEAENETKETENGTNAIDNALENTNLTDDQKEQIAETLKDESSTVVDKAEATTEAADSVYDDSEADDYPELMFQLAGEPSIRRMAESEERERILADLEAAQLLDDRYKSMDAKSKASRIRMMTGWEKDANGKWKYETDDSVNRIKTEFFKNNPGVLNGSPYLLNLGDILEADELYKVFPYMKNVRVSFYSDPNAFRAVLTPQGIKVNTRYLQGMEGEKGLKGVLAHEIQHIIQAMEYAESKGLQGADIEQLYKDMMNAMQAAGERKYDYDITSLQQGLDAYMQDAGEIEARNVARRILMNKDQRRMNTLASTEDVQRKVLFQTTDLTQEFADISSGKITDQDIANHIMSIIGQVFDTATRPLKIKLVNGNKAHVLGSNVKLNPNQKKKHNATLSKIESVINNASMVGKSEPVDLTHNTNKRTLKHKQNVLKYITFESPIKINNDYYTVELITERVKGQAADLLDLYNVRVRKNNPANTLSNPNGLNALSQGQVNNITTGGNVNTGVLLSQEEADEIRKQYENTEQWMKAPNGADSKLDEKQWLQVRTPSFKKWFGDWENDPANASKVVDENGEPLVIYHGSSQWFQVFNEGKINKSSNVNTPDNTIFTNDNKEIASSFQNYYGGKVTDVILDENSPLHRKYDWGTYRAGGVYSLFMNLRNPKIVDYKGQTWKADGMNINDEVAKAMEEGYDGFIAKNIIDVGFTDVTPPASNDYIAFNNTAVKSATDNNGNFDASNPNILFQIAGEIGAENLDNSEVQDGVSRMQNLAIAKQMEAEGKDAQAIRLATGWEKGDDGYWKWEFADDYHLKNIKATNEKLERYEKELKEAENNLKAFTENKEKAEHKIKDMVKRGLLPEGTTYETELEKAQEKVHIAQMLLQYDNLLDVEKALKRLIERGIDPTDFWNDMGESFYLPQLIDNPELFRAYPELEKVTIAFARKDVDNHMGGYNPEEKSITIFPAGAKTYTDFLSVLAHEVQHAIQRIEGFAKGGSTEQFKPRIRTKDEVINKDLQWAENLEDSYPDKKAEMQKIKSLMLDGNRSQAWEKIRALQKEAIEKDDRDYARYIDEYGYKLEKIQRNIIEEDIESPEQQYHRLAGEVEARNVQERMKFTPEQRLNTLLAATEDVAPEDKIILFQTVYHGTGADFDKFDTENFGLSGEGSMSFGYGTYLTDSEDIARDYAERQRPYGPNAWTYKGQPITDFETKQVLQFLVRNGFNKDETIKDIEDVRESYTKSIQEGNHWYTPEMIESIEKELSILTDTNFNIDDFKQDNDKAKLYTVEIPDDGYFTWNQNLEDKSLKGIKEALVEKGVTNTERLDNLIASAEQWKNNPNATYVYGSNIYRVLTDYLGGQKEASNFLHTLGYAGIKYPAGSIHGNGRGAYNYVIFNDDDAKIVDKLLFQTQAELMDEAKTFESWQDFMEYCETFHADDEVSPIPGDADAQWYQIFYETANGVKAEQEKNTEAAQAKEKKDTQLPLAMDALFSTFIRTDPQMVDSFLQMVADLDAIDLDSEEWQHVEDEEGAKQRERIEQLKDFINVTLSDYNWQTAMRRVQGGHEISEGLRKRLIGEMVDNFKTRDFRALYAEVTGDEQYAVAPEDSITAVLNKKLRKYHDIVKPGDDISKWSPERRKQLAEQLANREIAAKIKNGSLKLDDELDAYIKSLTKQIKEKQKQFDELEAETKADYQRIADKERRDLLKLHEQLLLARGKLKTRNQEIERKIKKGLKITEKYDYGTQNANADYDEIFRKYSDLRNSIEINAEIQAILDRQEQAAIIREDLNSKQKEKNLTAEIKKMRIQLVKKTMRRVPFNRIDYDNAKTVIAIQRMLEPNLLGGVNRFIGIDSPYLRGVISQIVTDSEFKEKIMNYLSKTAKASQAFADFKKKLENLKSIKDFDSWTAKDRKAAIRYLPKENWVRDLNLMQLAKEREESIDLDIGMEEVKRTVYDEKTGEPKTYKDAQGNEHTVTETAFKLKANEEIERLVQDAVGADMFNKIVNMPFSEWTTEDLEQLAQRIDEIYTEGRDMFAAKNEARKKEAAAIRKRIEDAIKETGITINDDDTPEEKERKRKQIEKILGMSSDLKGTEAGKNKGVKAKLNRLLHSYADMNVLRFARMLDGQSEGENVRMLYRMEDDCYNRKQRSMNARAETVHKVMADNKITEGDLAQTVKAVGTEFTVDELLYFLAADKDYAEDEKKLQRGLFGIDANDDYAATSRNAVMFGNMFSDTMSQEEKESWVQLDKDMAEALQNDTLTQEQKEELATGRLDKTPGTSRYIAACHAKWEAVLSVANDYLSTHPEYKALMEAIEADYASQYERMNEVSITEFNQPVHRVKAYVPLVRRESNGETNENQVKEDLLGANGIGKQWADRGMTQRRVNISPLNQKPVQTGLFLTWGNSIERTEHFIAYAPYVRQLNAVYKSRDAAYTRRFIESRYGAGAIKYLDEYINEVANPNAGRIRERGAEWLHVLRGKTAPAYLGWKASAIIKQGLTSPWPYMQFINPAEYTAAALKFTFNPEMREAIKEKSVFMKMRRMDPVNDLIDEMADNAKSKLDRGWSNFSKIGMQGLELIDWACVAPGWLACYEKKYNQLQNASNARYEAKMAELKERNMYADVGTSEYMTPQQMEATARKEITEDIETEAVRYADDCTRQCQPSNRVTDLAPLFKNSSEAMKAFLQFQTSLNVIWQNLRYDMPYAVKNKEFTRIAGTVIGYVCAGIFMNSVMDGIGGDDDDDEMQKLRNIIYYSTTQFTDSIPIMGSEITNTMDQLITGKRGFYGSGTDMTPSATKLLSVLTNAKKGNWQKAAELTAEGIGLFLGAPVSGAKEINKLLGKPLDNGEVDIKAGISDVYGIAGDIIGE